MDLEGRMQPGLRSGKGGDEGVTEDGATTGSPLMDTTSTRDVPRESASTNVSTDSVVVDDGVYQFSGSSTGLDGMGSLCEERYMFIESYTQSSRPVLAILLRLLKG